MSQQVHKGRGATDSAPGRFAVRKIEPAELENAELCAPQTRLHAMRAGRIISTNQSPDVPFDRSINPYQGCEHGCIYCYARPSHSYLDLSPGLDFETQIFYKANAVDRLLDAWQKPAYVCRPITIGANTDPYQPAEKTLKITRALLQTFLKHSHPVSIVSKGVLLHRDIDLLAALAARDLCSVAISIPTMDNALKRILEPRVPAASERFKLIRSLTDAGVPVSLLLAPIIPAINDNEIENIIGLAADAGVNHAAYIFLRLPHELKDIFTRWLKVHMPERAQHVMSLVRQASGGRDYDNRFGHRQRGHGPYAEMIGQRFRRACHSHAISTGGTDPPQALDCSRFQAPGQQQMLLKLAVPHDPLSPGHTGRPLRR